MKIGFFGTPELAASVLRDFLSASDMEVSYVVTQPDRPVGRHATITPSPVAQVATQAGIPIFRPDRVTGNSELLQALSEYEVDYMVVVAYGNILPQSILDLPRFLPINIHGSLLPRHRGASPIQTALLEGDTETGITIMKMVREMDAGDILSTYTIPLSPDETSGSLFEKFAVHSGPVVLEAIRSYAKGSICLLPQNHADATFTKKLEKSDGEMIWAGYSSKQLYHRWQACTPWPGVWTLYQGKRCKILTCSDDSSLQSIHAPGTIFSGDSRLFVACKTGSILLGDVVIEGKSPQQASKYLIPGVILGA